MDVLIVETKTGNLAAMISLAAYGNSHKQYDLNQRAWAVAVKSNAVDESRREDYCFRVRLPK